MGSASQLTDPSDCTLMYLYWTTWPAARLTVPLQSGLLEVYCEALRATALSVFQFPSAATLPTILMVWPKLVVTTSLKVTATEVPVAAQVEEDVVPVPELVVVVVDDAVPVDVEPPVLDWGVWELGKLVEVAVEYDPTTDVAWHEPGRVFPELAPHEYGTTPARRAAAVRNDA